MENTYNRRLKKWLNWPTIGTVAGFALFIMLLMWMNERNCQQNFEREFGIALVPARADKAGTKKTIEPKVHAALAEVRSALKSREDLQKAARYEYRDIQAADRAVMEKRSRFDRLVRLAQCACDFAENPASYPAGVGEQPPPK